MMKIVKHLKYLIYIFLTFLVFLGATNFCYAYELPDLGNPSANVLTPQENTDLGKEFMQRLRATAPLIDDPLLADYIQNLGDRLKANTTAKNRKLHFFLIADSSINAFSGPGGNVGVNSGLFLATDNESELAGVMSHELAHVSEHHLEQNLAKANKMQIPMLATAIAAILVGSKTNDYETSAAASGIAATTLAGGMQSMLNFSRENEYDADRIGMKTLYASGFDPNAFGSFLNKMQKMSMTDSERTPQYLSTHPMSSARMADAENRAEAYPKVNATSSKHYYLLKARLREMMFSNQTTALDYYQKQDNVGNQNKPLLYGYALALLDANQLTQAKTKADILLASDPNEIVYQMLLADIEEENHELPAALNTLKKAMLTKKGYYPLNIQYAHTLIEAGSYEEAKDILNKEIQKYPDNPYLLAMLSKAQFKSGQEAYGYLSRAKALEIVGSYGEAITLLQKALTLPDLTINTKAMLQAELERAKYAKTN